MRVLFYHDPVPELGRPFLWKSFVQWASSMRNALPETDCRFLLADSMTDWAKAQGVPPGELIAIREERLRQSLDRPVENWNRYWYEDRYSPSDCRAVGDFLGSALGEFVPDVILTHAPAPFLKERFPQSALLHYEAGLLKFPPFPMSFYFDPGGFFAHSWLARHRDALHGFSLSEQEQGEIDSLRKQFLDELLVPKSPFRSLMAAHSPRYPRRLLLPLQFGNFFGFDSHCAFHSQFEFARWVLERTPPDVGVVLTQHVYFEQLEDEALAFLRARFPNLIYEPVFDDYNTASQFLLGDVDAVVSVTSSVGMQSLWWRKPLIAIGESHLSVAADASDPAAFHELVQRPWPAWKDPLLYWLLTHYYVPSAYVYSGRWLPEFLRRRGTPELIDEPAAVFRAIREGAISGIGNPSGSALRSYQRAARERLELIERLNDDLKRSQQRADLLEREAENRLRTINELAGTSWARLPWRLWKGR